MVSEELLYLEVGKEVRRLRESKGYSQTAFADRLGLNRTSITNIEKGRQKATLFFIYQVCEQFNMLVSDFLPDMFMVMPEMAEDQVNDSGDIGKKTRAMINKYKNR